MTLVVWRGGDPDGGRSRGLQLGVTDKRHGRGEAGGGSHLEVDDEAEQAQKRRVALEEGVGLVEVELRDGGGAGAGGGWVPRRAFGPRLHEHVSLGHRRPWGSPVRRREWAAASGKPAFTSSMASSIARPLSGNCPKPSSLTISCQLCHPSASGSVVASPVYRPAKKARRSPAG